MRPQQSTPSDTLYVHTRQLSAAAHPAQPPAPAPTAYTNSHNSSSSSNAFQPARVAFVPSAPLQSFTRLPPPLNTALSPVPSLSSLVSPSSRSQSPAPPVPGPPPQPSPFSHPPPSFVAPFPYARAPLLPYNALSPMASSPASPASAGAGKQLHPFTFPLPSPSSPAPPLPSPPSLNPAISTGAALLALPRPPPLAIPRGPSPVPSAAASSSPRSYFVTVEGAVSVPSSTGSSPTGLHRQHVYPSMPSLHQAPLALPQPPHAAAELYGLPPHSRATSVNGLPPGMTLPQHPQPMRRAVSSSQQPHAQLYDMPPPAHSTAAVPPPAASFQHPLPARSFVPDQSFASLPYQASAAPAWLPGSTASPSPHAAMPAYSAASASAFPSSTSFPAPSFPPRFQWVTPVHPAHLQLVCSHFPESPELFDACPLPFGVFMKPLGPGLSLPASDAFSAPSSAVFSPAASATPSQVHAASPSSSGRQSFTFAAGHSSAPSLSMPPPASSSSAAAYHAPTPPIPTVRPGPAGVIRCKECKAYMNGYVLWLEQGRAWRCNICNADNNTPSSYYSPLNADGRRVDWDEREELRNASYEILAPKDYMVRPPVPPLVCLCINVSRESRDRGLLADVCSVFTQLVEDMARHPKSLLSILTFSDVVHYFTINSKGKGPVMHVLTTLDDLFLPSPVGLLVRVAECKSQLLSLLASLPTIHQASPASTAAAAASASPTPTCTASALECCMMIMGRYGGRLIVFTSSLCSAGRGLMKDREREATEGKGAQDAGGLEAALLKPGSDYYKKLSDTMQKHQITCDLLFFPPSFSSSPLSPPAYVDVSSHADLARYTGGQLYYFPRYSSPQSLSALRATLTSIVTRPQCFESVFRVRCSRGVSISDFHGHFSIRGTDLLSIPCCDCEKAISFDLRIDDKDKQYVSGNKDRVVVIQTGLLYTSFTGERRIIVHTAVVPLAKDVRRLLQGVNVDVCIGVMSKRAVWLAYAHSLQQARDFVRQKCSALMRTMQKAGFPVPLRSPSQPYAAAASFSQLSLYLLKSCFAQQSPALFIPSDQRCFLLCTLYVLPLHDTMRLVQPLLIPLHYLLHDARYGTLCPPYADPAAPSSGSAAAMQEVMWVPPACALTAASLSPDSLFLLHNGLHTVVRAGRAVDGAVMHELFEQDDAGAAPDSLRLRDADLMAAAAAGGAGSSLLQRVWAVIDEVRKESSLKSRVQVVSEGQQLDVLFMSMLADDSRDKEPGIREWEASLQ